MLFMQAALAIAACTRAGEPSRAAALTAQNEAPCHEQAPAVDPLCTAHCQASDPSLDKTPGQPAVAPLLAFPPLVFRVPAPQAAPPPAEVPPPASPPARILFQTLLI